MMFHKWLATDAGDQCFRCGVIAPDFGDGVISDHGPLPIDCPGPLDGPGRGPGRVDNPHHFLEGVRGIECAYCGLTLDDETLPATVGWECRV
jgi:hypothetical protein